MVLPPCYASKSHHADALIAVAADIGHTRQAVALKRLMGIRHIDDTISTSPPRAAISRRTSISRFSAAVLMPTSTNSDDNAGDSRI